MARFSEEEVQLLFDLVNQEIYDTGSSHLMVMQPEYMPFLQNLAYKLEKYHGKHYSDEEDSGNGQ